MPPTWSSAAVKDLRSGEGEEALGLEKIRAQSGIEEVGALMPFPDQMPEFGQV